jgi:hypothetical protein
VTPRQRGFSDAISLFSDTWHVMNRGASKGLQGIEALVLCCHSQERLEVDKK